MIWVQPLLIDSVPSDETVGGLLDDPPDGLLGAPAGELPDDPPGGVLLDDPPGGLPWVLLDEPAGCDGVGPGAGAEGTACVAGFDACPVDKP